MNRLTNRARRLPAWQIDIAIAAAVLTAELVNAILRIDDLCRVCDITPLRILMVALMSVPLAWRRRYPLVVFVVVGAAAGWNGVVDAPALNVGILIAVYSVAAYGSPAGAWSTLVLVVGALVAIHLDRGELGPDFRLDLTAFLPVWLLGRLTAARNRHIEDLIERAELAEREREHRSALAAAEERRSIARELHDIVAHGMSVMVVHAENAREAIADDPDGAGRSLEVIAETGRESITDLRRVLGVLRDQDDDAGLRPQPTLGDLPELVERSRAAGLPIELTVQVDRDVPASLGVSVHRIVQEALTNALRHASPTAVTVAVRSEADRLHVDVVNDGAHGAPHGGGHGLAGIRERASALGGSAVCEPLDGGRFRVAVSLPMGSAS
jgi:signal transduction histidine kinase